MKINIDENYYIEFDGVQYMPFKFKPEGVIQIGKNKGKAYEAQWVHCGKYFNRLDFTLNWIVSDSLASGGDMHLGEFIEGYLDKLDELNKACKGV